MRIIVSLVFLIAFLLNFNKVLAQFSLVADSISFIKGKRNHQFDQGDTLYTKSGYKFYHGQVLKIGAGSGEKGYFKHIFLVCGSNTDMTYVGTLMSSVDRQFLYGSGGHKQGLVDIIHDGPMPVYKSYNSDFDLTSSMPPTASGKEFIVRNLKYTGSKKRGYSYMPVIAEPKDAVFSRKKEVYGTERYFIDYENAVNSGELIYPGKQPVNKNTTSVEVKVVQEKSESNSVADELAKLKKLFDAGAITKDEYDTAKKKLLNRL